MRQKYNFFNGAVVNNFVVPDFEPAEFKEVKRLRLGEWSANQSEFNYLEEKSKKRYQKWFKEYDFR